MRHDRQEIINWARALLADEFIILDSETTGLYSDAEIVQLAVIDKAGQVLIDTLIKPTQPIPPRATAIHHITDEMVADAPTFDQIYNALLLAIGGKRVAIYNAPFDVTMLHQSEQHCNNYGPQCLGIDGWRGLALWEDVMIPYSDYVGDWSDYHGNNRWQPLPGGDHSALGDCRSCLALIKRMAGVLNAEIVVPLMDNELHGYADHYGRFYLAGNYREPQESPLENALSAFVADLVGSYSDRHGSMERERLANDWFKAWRRDLGWRPAFERDQGIDIGAAKEQLSNE